MNRPTKNFLALQFGKLAITTLVVLVIVAAIIVKGQGAFWFCTLAVLLVAIRVFLGVLSLRRRRQLVAQLLAQQPSFVSPVEALARSRRQRMFVAGYCIGLAIPAAVFAVLASILPELSPLGYFVAAGLGVLIVLMIVLGEIGIRRRAPAITES